MKPPSLIALAGRARTGKNTVADFIKAEYGGYYTYAFADPIKNMLMTGLGIDLSTDYWATRKEEIVPVLGKSPRQLMQTLGTEWGRRLVNPDLWLILAKNHLRTFGPGMIITDARFENETAWVRSVGGKVVHVVRDSAPGVTEHTSEAGTSVQPEDIVLYNNLDLESLHHAVSKLFRP